MNKGPKMSTELVLPGSVRSTHLKRVLIVGGTGLIGSALTRYLAEAGYEVAILTRNSGLAQISHKIYQWNPANGQIAIEELETDIIINLAGEGIVDQRWSQNRKKNILESRTKTTEFLINSLKLNKKHCKIYIGASAIGFYGDTGEKLVVEESLSASNDFLSFVCKQWEESHERALDISDRQVVLRIGTVLTKEGGALPEFEKTIRWGFTACPGDGKQYMSWIHIDDLLQVFNFVIKNELINGPLNAVAPAPEKMSVLMDIIREIKCKSAFQATIPSWIIKTFLGERSELLLNSSRVSSEKLCSHGFVFNYPTLEKALRSLA